MTRINSIFGIPIVKYGSYEALINHSPIAIIVNEKLYNEIVVMLHDNDYHPAVMSVKEVIDYLADKGISLSNT